MASICDFLGVENDIVRGIPPVRVSIFGDRQPARRTPRRRTRGRAIPSDGERPELAVQERRDLIAYFADDIRRVEELLGRSFWDWFSEAGAGTYRSRSRRKVLARRELRQL